MKTIKLTLAAILVAPSLALADTPPAPRNITVAAAEAGAPAAPLWIPVYEQSTQSREKNNFQAKRTQPAQEADPVPLQDYVNGSND